MMPRIFHPYFAAFLLSSLAALPTVAHAGESLIPNGDFASGMDGWSLNKLEHTEADAAVEAIENGKHAIHIKVPQAGAKRYFVQLLRNNIRLSADKTYHLRFRARSQPGCELILLAATNHGKYNEIWRQEHITVKPEWSDVTADIKPTATDDTAIILFSGLAAQSGDYWLTDITLEEAN